MLRIMEIHAAENPQSEYIVLQNVGLISVELKGWAVCTDAYLEGTPTQIASGMYIFREAAAIKPYTRVVLFTGAGENGWVPTTDGTQAYCAFWNRRESAWTQTQSAHVLHVAGSRPVVQPHAQFTKVSTPESASSDTSSPGSPTTLSR